MSETGSKSWSTPRYRQVGMTSTIDESLFGNGSTSVGNKSSRRLVRAPLPSNSVVVTAWELEKIKNNSLIKSESDIIAEREAALRIKEEKEKKARERKDRMKELEKRAAQLAKKSDMEIADMAKKAALREMAEKQLDNNSDVVKLLNSMAQRAAAYSIRDQQLLEKHRLEQLEKQLEVRSDVNMELDRLRDIQRREEEEKDKRFKRVDDRKVINEQIAERERFRMLQLEAREQENQAMRELMKRYAEEDARAAEKRQVMIEKSRLEVIKANEDAIRRKREAREAEKKEVEDILIYQAQKDAELAKREAEEEEIAKLKKERQAKLLAEQERAQNNAGKLDELRARRAAEEKEREARQKEKAEAIKRKAEMKELLEARAKQAEDKILRQRQLKEAERDEIVYQLQYTKKMDDREAAESEAKALKLAQFRQTLQAQIEEIERMKSRQRENPDDGSGLRQELIREEEKLKVIRDKMVRDLVAQGVDPKYLSEMRNVDIGKILRR